jgi:hypothetical protein
MLRGNAGHPQLTAGRSRQQHAPPGRQDLCGAAEPARGAARGQHDRGGIQQAAPGVVQVVRVLVVG